jgi:hypothetical protein
MRFDRHAFQPPTHYARKLATRSNVQNAAAEPIP